jgi:hypothetical protein
MKKYDLASSLDILNDFVWFSMMGVKYDGERSLVNEDKRYKTFTSLLSKNGIDCERLAGAGKRMLQGKQVRDLNLERKQFTMWCKLCKSLIPEFNFGLDLLTVEQFEALNPWLQEETYYGASRLMLMKLLSIEPERQFDDVNDDYALAEIEKIDLLQMVEKKLEESLEDVYSEDVDDPGVDVYLKEWYFFESFKILNRIK